MNYNKLKCFFLLLLILAINKGCDNHKKKHQHHQHRNETMIEKKVEISEIPIGLKLIEQNDCRGCHDVNKKMIGPTYKEIANKYTIKDSLKLIKSIINGSQGVWGKTPMSPHLSLSHSDAKYIVEYIISNK